MVGNDIQYSCKRVAMAVCMHRRTVLRHGSATDVCNWAVERRKELILAGDQKEADSLIAVSFSASMTAEELNRMIDDPCEFLPKWR